MTVPIRISDETYRLAKRQGKPDHRSPPQQIEFWVAIGRSALDNPDLPVEMIKEMLRVGLNDLSDCVPFTFEQK